jgi:hypothetical protein
MNRVRALPRPAVWIAGLAVAVALALTAATGVTGILYLPVYVVAIAPGVLLGRRLAGPTHPVGWLAGGALGYGLIQLALWVPIALHIPSRAAFAAAWLLGAIALWLVSRRMALPALPLPAWLSADWRALCLTLLLVPAVMGPPYRNLGAADQSGTRFYRAYFTADFVWHTALAAELGRYDTPPRNPYMASADLHYYWTYFLLPSVVAQEAPLASLGDLQNVLKANALLSALLLIGLLYLVVRLGVPGPGIAAAAVALGVLAASAEGTFVLQQLLRQGIPLAAVEDMNIDAISNWQLGGLRVDNVPRSLWYTPQHAFSCALGLIAMLAAAAGGARVSQAGVWVAGTALGLSTCFNPLLGGMFSLTYGLAVLVDAVVTREPRLLWTLLRHAQAAVPVALALGWAAVNEVAEGAGSAVTMGFGGFARRNTVPALLLSTGPALAPAVAGLWPWRRLPSPPARLAAIGVVLALLLMHFVTLSEASWVGFRAGQILLLMLPILVARLLWSAAQRGTGWAVALAAGILVAGLPTTIIDTYNAQDITNRRQGPGFHWTLPVTPAQQDAFAWVRANLPEDATLQMEPMLRGREHWSLIPTFAERRMTAGLPISLLPVPEYDRVSAEVQRLYQTSDAREAWNLARGRGIDYLYIDQHDRAAYPEGVAKFSTAPYFEQVFDNGEVAIYKVR